MQTHIRKRTDLRNRSTRPLHEIAADILTFPTKDNSGTYVEDCIGEDLGKDVPYEYAPTLETLINVLTKIKEGNVRSRRDLLPKEVKTIEFSLLTLQNFISNQQDPTLEALLLAEDSPQNIGHRNTRRLKSTRRNVYSERATVTDALSIRLPKLMQELSEGIGIRLIGLDPEKTYVGP